MEVDLGESMSRKHDVKCVHCNSDINREWLHTQETHKGLSNNGRSSA